MRKKFIISIIVLSMMVGGVASAAVVLPIPENGASWWMIAPRITSLNYNVNTVGDEVTVNYLTTQFMNGGVVIVGMDSGIDGTHMTNEWHTYHTVKVTLPAGDYGVRPYAIDRFGKKHLGGTKYFTIK